jgi:hypothetical protein
VFWLAPLIGAAIAGIAYPYLFGRHEALADRLVRDEALEADDDSGQHWLPRKQGRFRRVRVVAAPGPAPRIPLSAARP